MDMAIIPLYGSLTAETESREIREKRVCHH